MFVDAQALLAILLDEVDAKRMVRAIETAPAAFTSPIAIFETVAGLMRDAELPRVVAEERVRAAVALSRIKVIPITEEIGHLAIDAFDRYGKGRGHPARLNMGDCFAYACAKAHGLSMLYKGDDFRRTDLA